MIKEVELGSEHLEKPQLAYEVGSSSLGYHRLSINSLMHHPKEQIVVSTAFDQQVLCFESLSNKHILKYENPQKALFSHTVWYGGMLVAADEAGCLHCIELNSDKAVEQIRRYQLLCSGISAGYCNCSPSRMTCW